MYFYWISLMVQWLESACECRGHGLYPWLREILHAMGQLSPCATTTEARVPRVCAPQ